MLRGGVKYAASHLGGQYQHLAEQEVESFGALTLAPSPNEVAVNRIFPRLHCDVGVGRWTSIVVRCAMICMPDVFSCILGGMDVTPVGGVRSISISSHITSKRRCLLCHSPDS